MVIDVFFAARGVPSSLTNLLSRDPPPVPPTHSRSTQLTDESAVPVGTAEDPVEVAEDTSDAGAATVAQGKAAHKAAKKAAQSAGGKRKDDRPSRRGHRLQPCRGRGRP